MRFYNLTVTDPNGGSQLLQYGSYPNGQYDPGAPNVIFDCIVYPQSTPMGGSTIRVEGVDPSTLSNAHAFSGMTVALSGGMGAGLPLTNPQQQGLLVQGQAFQSFANWVGTQLDLVFVLLPSPYSLSNPGNIVLNWKAGAPLSTALRTCLQTAFPKATISMNISQIVLSHDEVHAASTLSGLATYLDGITPTHVQIVINGNTIRVFDSTYKPTAKTLVFTDMIGQPVWLQPQQIQIRLVLRGDLQVGDTIQMPQGYANFPGFVQTTAASMPSQMNYKTSMQGQFNVFQVRHIGNLRQPNGAAWCTMINAVPLSSAGAQ